jgi:nitrate reductase NapE component
MELYSGAKMVNEKDLKTKYLRSKNREFTVLDIKIHKKFELLMPLISVSVVGLYHYIVVISGYIFH